MPVKAKRLESAGRALDQARVLAHEAEGASISNPNCHTKSIEDPLGTSIPQHVCTVLGAELEQGAADAFALVFSLVLAVAGLGLGVGLAILMKQERTEY